MILTKEVEVKPTGKMIQYYKNKGYDAKYKVPLVVKVEDLSRNSFMKIEVLCDCCKEEICTPTYYDYCNKIEKFGDYACYKCAIVHYEKNFVKKYGVKNPMQNKGFKKKQQDSLMEHFGVYTPLKNEEIKQRAYDTSMERFGTMFPSTLPEIKEKTIQSNLKKFGVPYVSQCKDVREKMTESYLLHYGYESPAQSPEIRAKMNETLYKNGTQKTSKQQLYLYSLYGGELNYPVSQCSLDICFPDEKFFIEYNGGGHDLGIKTGKITQEEFNTREMNRFHFLKRQGYKQMTIVSSHDKLPSDTVLLQMLQDTRTYFQTTSHTWFEFNIDTNSIRNAEYKEGLPYNYGDLRTISTEDIAS